MTNDIDAADEPQARMRREAERLRDAVQARLQQLVYSEACRQVPHVTLCAVTEVWAELVLDQAEHGAVVDAIALLNRVRGRLLAMPTSTVPLSRLKH